MTVVFGMPIPSRDPIFLGIIALHVLAGLAAVASGLFAMRLPKGRGRHSKAGIVYFWSLAALFASATTLSAIRWPNDIDLFLLGALAFAFGILARLAARRGWDLRIHAGGMAASFIVMLTAFYVDNGPSLPFWRDLPPIAYWIMPAVLGVPIILWAFVHHPLLQTRPQSSQT